MTTGTSREALVAELLGDVLGLLDRIDAVMPKLEAATKRMEQVSDRLPVATEQVIKLLAVTMNETGHQAASHAADHAVGVVSKNSKAIFLAQTEELRATAKVIFDEQVTPPLRQLTAQLHAAIRNSHDPWDRWLTHAATAVVAFCLPTVVSLVLSLVDPSPAKASSIAPVPECVRPALAPADPAGPAAGSTPPASKARVRH